jgi:hypothetical protein
LVNEHQPPKLYLKYGLSNFFWVKASLEYLVWLILS